MTAYEQRILEEHRSQKAAQQQSTWIWIESITHLEEHCSQEEMELEEGPMVGCLDVGLNARWRCDRAITSSHPEAWNRTSQPGGKAKVWNVIRMLETGIGNTLITGVCICSPVHEIQQEKRYSAA